MTRVDLSPDVTIYLADCRDALPMIGQVDSVVCDPPYGLSKEPDIMEVLRHWMAGDDYNATGGGFMGKTWDSFVPGPTIWREVERCMKPGAYCLSFASTRTFDLMAIALRMAGMEQHPFLAWCFASGFPKATNLGQMIDRMAGAEREVSHRHIQSSTKPNEHAGASVHITMPNSWDITAPATDAAKKWEGWFYGKQSLKPAIEPVLMFQKPFAKGLNGAENVLAHGTGAINIAACRVETEESTARTVGKTAADGWGLNGQAGQIRGSTLGRWPANLIHSGEPSVVGLFPQSKSAKGQVTITKKAGTWDRKDKGMFDAGRSSTFVQYGDSGSAARFFKCCPLDDPDAEVKRLVYVSKASKADRDEGCEGLEERFKKANGSHNGRVDTDDLSERWQRQAKNFHPTVKPTALMRYLCRLVTPPRGVVLDPFMGSGSTGKAALREGFRFIGIERDPEFFAIAKARLERELAQPRLALPPVPQAAQPEFAAMEAQR